MSTGQLPSAIRSFRLQGDVPDNWNAADLQQHLGGIPLHRICLIPPPGCASEDDVIRLHDVEHRLCELLDGILVEKTMGWYESILAGLIITRINVYLESHNLGKVLGPDGTLRFLPGLVKIPDVSFVSWQRWPQQSPPRRPIPAIIPDLIIEVLSDGNTDDEMEAKLRVYQQAGVRMIWYINPKSCDAVCHRSAGESTYIARDGVLYGEDVLPDFQLSVSELFTRADQQRPAEE
ncbi:MAG: Uma2 family endonuclease [Planctomycetaceae bacterium]